MESIDHTFNQARTDFNFICTKLAYKDEELSLVCAFILRTRRNRSAIAGVQSRC